MFNKKPISSTVFAMGTSENGNQYGGASYKSTFDISKVGDGKLEKYKVREGKNLIDVIPFNAGPNHPLVVTGQCSEGDTMYSLDYFIHKGIGPSNQDFVCLQQYRMRCPLCDESKRLYQIGTEDAKKQGTSVRSKRRCVYLVRDLLDNKYYYMEAAWFSFEKHVNERAMVTTDPATGTQVNPFDWENGKSISFLGVKDKFNGKDYVKISEGAFDLVNRQPLSDEVLNHSVDLSAGLVKSTEEEMDAALAGKPVVSSAPTTTQSESVAQTAAPQQSAPVENNTVTQSEPVVQNNVEQAPQPEPQVQSAPAAQSSEKVCPFGHKWGEADGYDECATCQAWDKCIDG